MNDKEKNQWEKFLFLTDFTFPHPYCWTPEFDKVTPRVYQTNVNFRRKYHLWCKKWLFPTHSDFTLVLADHISPLVPQSPPPGHSWGKVVPGPLWNLSKKYTLYLQQVGAFWFFHLSEFLKDYGQKIQNSFMPQIVRYVLKFLLSHLFPKKI